MSAMNINGNWLGSLNSLEGGEGYWLVADTNFTFEYNIPDGISLAKGNLVPEVPKDFSYNQSIAQSFYFVEDIHLSQSNIEHGDWIVAYNEETIVGARMWDGEYTDIPAMGFDITDENTLGYCENGDIPTFKLYKSKTNEVIDLVSNHIPKWENNRVVIIELSGLQLPQEVSLGKAYPNPFNPTTTIHYEIPEGGMNVNLSIYDIRGRLVNQLVNEYQAASYNGYNVIWNASNMASGTYFVRLHAGNSIETQKIMLIK